MNSYFLKLLFLIILPVFTLFYSYVKKYSISNVRFFIYGIVMLIVNYKLGPIFFISLFVFATINSILVRKINIWFLVLINISILGFLGNFHFVLSFIKLYFNLKMDIRVPDTPDKITLFVFGLYQLVNLKKGKSIGMLDYISLSLCTVILPVLILCDINKVLEKLSKSEFRNPTFKEVKFAAKLLCIGFITRMVLTVPCYELISKGILIEFSSNMVQSVFSLLSNSIYYITQLFFLFFVLYSVQLLIGGGFFNIKILLSRISLKFENCSIKSICIFIFKCSLICLLSGFGLLQSTLILVFLMSFILLWRIKLKFISFVFGLLVFLCVSAENIYQVKFIIQGLFSVHTLFIYYNELFLIHTIGGDFFLSLFIIALGVTYIIYWKRFFNKWMNITDVNVIYLLIVPILILFQL